jgi:MFS family permease
MAIVPGLGDRFGYRGVALVTIVVKLIALAAIGLVPSAAGPLFAALFVIGVAGAGLTAMTAGPMTGHGVPAPLAATATGIVVGCGEILGGAIAPASAGFLAARLGIEVVPVFVFCAALIGLLAVAIGAREPGDRRGVVAAPSA